MLFCGTFVTIESDIFQLIYYQQELSSPFSFIQIMRRLPFVICIILLISYNFTQAKPRNVLPFDVELTKTVNNTTPGQNSNVTFTLTVFNNSGTDALNVQVKDILPSVKSSNVLGVIFAICDIS